MSDNSTPPPYGQQPPYPGSAPAQPYAQPPAQPTQAYPGAAPSFTSPQSPPSAPQAPYSAPQGPYSAPLQPYVDPRYAIYPAPRPASGLAITSLVCGIVGVVFGTFLFWVVLPFIASVVAIITGHIALRKTKADPNLGGRGMAFAGLIMGYAMTAIQLIIVAVILFGFIFVGAFTLPFVFAS